MKRVAGVVVVAFLVYQGLLRALDAKSVASVALSSGAHTPAWALLGGALLVALRLALFVLAPGALLASAAWSLSKNRPSGCGLKHGVRGASQRVLARRGCPFRADFLAGHARASSGNTLVRRPRKPW